MKSPSKGVILLYEFRLSFVGIKYYLKLVAIFNAYINSQNNAFSIIFNNKTMSAAINTVNTHDYELKTYSNRTACVLSSLRTPVAEVSS
jgi:hypothetical protein